MSLPPIPDGPRLIPVDTGVPDDLDLLAAEYALGSLDATQRNSLLAAHPGPVLLDRIAAWELRLAPLAECVPAASPPPELWQRLVLAAGIAPPSRPSSKTRAAQATPANTNSLWQFATAASLLLAAALGAYAFAPTMQSADPMLAALSPSGVPGAQFMVRVDGSGLATVFPLGPATTSTEGRSLQLWSLAEGATIPASLGLLNPAGAARIRIRSATGTRLLVTLEPAGGSPTGKPTGPVVFAGRLTNGT